MERGEGEGEDGRQGEDNMGRWRGERERERMAGKERTTWVGGEGRGERERMAGKERTTWVGPIGRNYFITNWLTVFNSSFVNAYAIQQLNHIKLSYHIVYSSTLK